MELLFETRGGGRIGFNWPLFWYGTWPFSKLQIFSDRITLSVFPFKKTINLNEIDFVGKTAFWGIKIEHHGSGCNYLFFYSFKQKEILSVLKNLGIKTTG